MRLLSVIEPELLCRYFKTGLAAMAIQTPTVLILGAGASVDYDYPTGPGLRDLIINGLRDESYDVYRRISPPGENIYSSGLVDDFRTRFRRSPFPTIDQFLEENRNYEVIGKQSIVAALLPFENPDTLDRMKDMRWYDFLWDRLVTDFPQIEKTTEARLENFTSHQLSIITFNYDRSLEEYLGRGLQHAFGFDDKSTMTCLRHLKMIHVYGTLGARPYMDANHRSYGDVENVFALQRTAEHIRIAGSRGDEEVNFQFALAHREMEKAKQIVLLGFGYDEVNLQRLDLLDIARRQQIVVYGTTYEMSVHDVHVVLGRLNLDDSRFIPLDMDCLQAFALAKVALV